MDFYNYLGIINFIITILRLFVYATIESTF